MSEHAKTVASNLQADIDVVVDALRSLEASVTQLRARFPEDHLQIPTDESLALWAHYHFDGNWNAFIEFAEESLRKWPRDKSQMWVWKGPDSELPETEAQRHLDRLRMGLQFIARELNTSIPVDTESHWHQLEYAERLQSYARAANDVLNPSTVR